MAISALRKRSPRKAVRLHGRMRDGFEWIDLSIRDISRKGLMAEAPNPPGRGHYIEIRRYDQVLVGRVVWKKGNRFGVTLADELDFTAVIKGKITPGQNDRRNHSTRPDICQARIIEGPADWRWIGQTIERASISIFGAGFVGLLAYFAFDALLHPISAISEALKP